MPVYSLGCSWDLSSAHIEKFSVHLLAGREKNSYITLNFFLLEKADEHQILQRMSVEF